MVSWERLAEQSDVGHVSADFERAAYRLMVEQILYANDKFSRVAYHLIVKHLAAFREVMSMLGVHLIHNAHHSYVAAIPNHNVAEKMRLSETRLALVLRRIYDDRMQSAEIAGGEAFVSLEELERAYKEWLKRELPERGELRELTQAMKRYGLVRILEADDVQPYKIVIRPGIVDVLSEGALHQLAAHAPIKDEGADDDLA